MTLRVNPGCAGEFISNRIHDIADAVERLELPVPSCQVPDDEWNQMSSWERNALCSAAQDAMYRLEQSVAIASCRRQWTVRPERRETLVPMLASAIREAGGNESYLVEVLTDLDRETNFFSSPDDLKAQAASLWALASGICEVQEPSAQETC